jgi:uncharacterized protein (TIGR02270 family)
MPSNTQLQPPVIGFTPSEISALKNRRVVDEHAVSATFLWKLRERAVYAPHYKLKHLWKLDMRLLAHLRGLQVAGEEGWRAVQQLLADADSGVIFVAAFVAYASFNVHRMHQMLLLALERPPFESALRAALAWQENSVLRPTLDRLAGSSYTPHRRISLAVAASRRIVPAGQIERAAHDPDAALRARAMRAIGEIAGRDQLHLARAVLHDPDPSCRFWAVWSATLLGERSGARILFEAAISQSFAQQPAWRALAVDAAMRCGEFGWAREMLRALAEDPDQRRTALYAAGSLGEPATVPWLLEHLDDPKHARLAGQSFSMLTGADIDYLDLDRDAPENVPDPVPYDEDLRWPDRNAVEAWWTSARRRFAPGRRYLCGELVSAVSCARVLREGFQRQRAAATIELTHEPGTAAVFPVRARSDWQRRSLA